MESMEEDVDDPMEIDDSVTSAPIIIRNPKGVEIIGGKEPLKDTNKEDDSGIPTISNNVVNNAKPAVTDSGEVVVLDEDDEENDNATTVPEKSQEEPVVTEVIDLVEKPINSICINYGCKSGKELMRAPEFCLSFYRVRNSEGKKIKLVCQECFDTAMQGYNELVAALEGGNPLCNVNLPLRNDTVEIDDSDEEIDDLPPEMIIGDDIMKFLQENIEKVINTTVEKYDVQNIVQKEVLCLEAKNKHLQDKLCDIQEMIKETRTTLDDMQISLYNEFRVETIQDPEIILDGDGPDSTDVDDNKGIRRSARKVPRKPLPGEETIIKKSPLPQAPEPPIDLPADVPVMGKSEAPKPVIDETYYISRENFADSWIKARLKLVMPPGTAYNNQSSSQIMYKVLELKQHKERAVDGKNIAPMYPSKVRLEVGTRVIAVFKEPDLSGEFRRTRHDTFYAGVVAEPPVSQNKYRYLVFFDIGYSQYVSYLSVYRVFEQSKNVWEDVPANSRQFIKKYLETDDKPRAMLSRGQKIRTEYNGKWVLCTVKDVDCSLVLVLFDSLNRIEWIYRGSTRLSPMFKEEQCATNKRHTGGRTSSRKMDPTESSTIVQYMKNSDFEKPTPPGTTGAVEISKTTRSVAKKSTSMTRSDTEGFVPFLPPINNLPPPPLLEPPSKIMYFTPRDQVVTLCSYRAHTCSPACKDFVRHAGKLTGHNPLAKPLICGWARITYKAKGRQEVTYKAPCSRMLRNMKEVHDYLRKTKSNLTVDLFDFNHRLRCLAEYRVECNPNPKDLSKGREQVPVPVINGITSDVLEFSDYTTKRMPMTDVNLNTDPNFLVCCDCQDDCADKSKCSCWQLTLEAEKYMGKNVDPDTIGYTYRRLYEQVLTGIYECNSRCKCASTCLNRVVQNPMSVKLQVFRTHNRGWGIRCVNDIPQGNFICIYAGTIHTEQMANEDGVAHGDEYFAELDYIENCEKHKEDYEEDVVDPESRSPSPDEDDDYGQTNTTSNRCARRKYNEDNDFLPAGVFNTYSSDSDNAMRLRRRRQERNVTQSGKRLDEPPKETQRTMDNLRDNIETVMISDDEDDPKEVLSFNPKGGSGLAGRKFNLPSIRSYFGEDEPYIMDTKNSGNIGRFLNHSCSPNVFVQNVFVDSHDLRFPWVAFFSSQFIRAGQELTWNYNYDVGSVPGRVLYCHCGSLECKGRLL